jgi:hypothetical protein
MIFAPALIAAFLKAMWQQKLMFVNNELRTFCFLCATFLHGLFSLHIKHNLDQRISHYRPVMPFRKLKRHYGNLLSNGWLSEWKAAPSVSKSLHIFSFLWRCGPRRAKASSFMMFLDHTQRRTTVSERVISSSQTPLPDNTEHNRQTSMPPGGIRTHNHRRRAAADLRLRSRGHWDRPLHI